MNNHSLTHEQIKVRFYEGPIVSDSDVKRHRSACRSGYYQQTPTSHPPRLLFAAQNNSHRIISPGAPGYDTGTPDL